MSGIHFSNNRTTLSLFDSSNSLITTLPIGATIYVQVSSLVLAPSSPPLSPSSASSPPSSLSAPGPSPTSALVSRTTADARVWHQRTGHISVERLKLLEKGAGRGIEIEGWNQEELAECQTCARGKLARSPTAKSSERKEGRLERVVADAWGPSPIPGSKGSRYMVGMIDSASRWMWVKPIRTKLEVAGAIEDWITKVERETGGKVKVFQSDQGGEFVGGTLADFLRRKGIRHFKTVAYIHSQNGLIERQWRTLLETTRCLLLDSNLPLTFWDQAALHALHLRNRSPTSSLPSSITPYEAFYGHPPDLSDLRTWGCGAEILIEGPKRGGKLESKTVRGWFVGFEEGMKGWKFWVPEWKRMAVAWSVKWFENEFKEKRGAAEEEKGRAWLDEMEARSDEADEGRRRQEGEELTDAQDLAAADLLPQTSIPSPPNTNAKIPSPAAPPPRAARQRGAPPSRTSSRLTGQAPTHFVPLAGAPVAAEPSSNSEGSTTGG